MINYEKVKCDWEVLTSLRFYFMLSTYLCSRGVTEYESTQSMKEFIKEGKDTWHKGNSKVLSAYLEQAYAGLPADFLSFMEISTKGDRDTLKIVDTKYTWLKNR